MPVPNEQLSPHFSLREMLTSQSAVRFNYSEQFDPPAEVIESLRHLCKKVLEPVRIAIDKPVRISSGYRCFAVNKKIGGSKTSQHMFGEAADIQVLNMSVEQLFLFIKNGNFAFDQLIQEFDSWIHVSYRKNPRRQVLRAIKQGNGHTKYIPG